MHCILLLALFCSAVLAQANRTACSISAELEREVRALPAVYDLSKSWEERMAPRRALAQKYPDNWPLQFLLQDPIRQHFHLGREWDRAIDHYRSLKDRTLGELLEARLLSRLHRNRSREMLDHVMAQAGDSPWTHLAMLEWIGESSQAEGEFEAFRRVCPESLRPFAHLDAVRDPDKLYANVLALRKLMDAKKKEGSFDEDLWLFRSLWKWEGILSGSERAEEFQPAVRSDLAALQNTQLYESPAWYSILRFGYENTLKDQAAMDALRKEVLERAPRSQAAYWILEQRSPNDQARLERLERFWGQPFARHDAQFLLINPASKLEAGQVERLADFVLSVDERFPDEGASWPPVSLLVADVYVRRKIRLDRVPALVDQALEQIEYQEKYRRDADILKNMPNSRLGDKIQVTQDRAREVMLRHALATGQEQRARALLNDWRRELEDSKPPDKAGPAAAEWQRKREAYLRVAKEAGLDPEFVAELMPSNMEWAERFPVGDFEVKDLTGRTWRLADLKGKVAYVNVWTTWCAPCRAEMPGIQKLYERWKDRKDRVVVTISADFHPMLVESFLKDTEYSFPVVHGKEIAEKFFPVVYFPQNWIIDPQGRRLDIPAPRASEATIPRIEELADKVGSVP